METRDGAYQKGKLRGALGVGLELGSQKHRYDRREIFDERTLWCRQMWGYYSQSGLEIGVRAK